MIEKGLKLHASTCPHSNDPKMELAIFNDPVLEMN